MTPTPDSAQARKKVLLELRPAFDGHAGIPQETRLLFRGLQALEELSVSGLIQSSGHVLAPGLPGPAEALSMPRHRQLNRLSRVVVSLRELTYSPHAAAYRMLLRQLFGMKEALSHFEGEHFRDFLWRSLFSRTLHPDDFLAVTGARFRLARVPWVALHRVGIATRRLGHAFYPRIDTSDFRVMIAETPFPGRVSPGTQLVVRYHDAIPILMPHTIAQKEYHQASHYHALRQNVASGAFFACVSESTRRDLLSIFPEAESRSVTIHNMISNHYFPEESSPTRVMEIVRTRMNEMLFQDVKEARRLANTAINLAVDGSLSYLLIVSTIEPRKNHLQLLTAWEHLRAEGHADLKLVVVGSPGWDYEPIAAKFRPWMERGDLFVLQDVPSPELRVLYRHARATVCPSLGEGFDYSGVEAMRCEGPVVASRIPTHLEIYEDAAEYFDPYSVESLITALRSVIDDEGGDTRGRLVSNGGRVSSRYTAERLIPAWREFLGSL